MKMNAETLNRFVPFSSLSPQTREQLNASAEEITCAPGQVIFRQGKEDGKLYFLLESEVALQQAWHSPLYVRAASLELFHDKHNTAGQTRGRHGQACIGR